MLDGLDAKFWLTAANTLVGMMVMLVGWWWKRLRDAQREIDDKIKKEAEQREADKEALVESVARVEHRLTLAEAAITHMPSRGDIGDIYEEMNKINGDMKELIGGQKAMTNSVQMITQHLMGDNKT